MALRMARRQHLLLACRPSWWELAAGAIGSGMNT
jgi:hypothetical protein